ncbi:deleted in malignant brain tumors 1 protein-like [Dendronephthya gigantea]|uniref:deleted in malignant brain tumors 1 protein-like n=1 Tax=Dendronephthya gigantea TaxID=151771 RepID=UPI00106AE3AC|nr:deleted in malignant brain tumors 1 protein-like [Dendronephthya gigantea]
MDDGEQSVIANFTDIPVRVRLQGPSSENGTGRVEVLYHGHWGTICDDGWDIRDATVVCRQLGYRDVVRTLQKNDVPSGSGQIWLSYVSCSGDERNITNCSYNGWGKTHCSHHQDAGVECTNTDFTGIPVTVRLQGPSSANGTGRVEVLYHGYWGTICDYGWDIRDARVVCRQLGYQDAVRSLQRNEVLSGSGQIWLSGVSCAGSEQNITNCSHGGWGNHRCSHQKDVGVECTKTDFTGIPVTVRLQGLSSKNGTGRVEVFYHGYWGTICDYRWDMKDAKVVCRQLGYPDVAKILQRNEVPSGSEQIWLDNVNCTGEEQNISSCSHPGWGIYGCDHSQDAGVECSTTEFTATPVRLRLQGPLSANGTGHVEVLHHGYWGAICARGWDRENARVVCRQLGYDPDGAKTFQWNLVAPAPGPLWLKNVRCIGNEQNITSCSYDGWGFTSCSSDGVAGVHCYTIDFTGVAVRLRLQGPLGTNGAGRVEVLYHGYWGTICDRRWDINDARVVCRQLGYRYVVRTLQRNDVPSGSGLIWLSDLYCTGNEQNISSCSHDGWGSHRCSHNEDAGVHCTNTDFTGVPVKLRLQGPLSASGTGRVEIFLYDFAVVLQGPLSSTGTGRVEVFYNGRWGTICEEGWDLKDARVVCRQLGYKDAARVLHDGQVPSGSGPIWLSDVDCKGEEKSIATCSHKGWGSNHCSRRRDVGVECTTKDFTDTPVSIRLQGPSSRNGTGRVEVFYHGYWGTICDYTWDMRDARVVCRQLGYQDVAGVLRRGEVPSGSGQVWLARLACTGKEQNITSCSHSGWGVDPCSHREDAGVICSTTDLSATPVGLRLQGPLSTKGIGRVELSYRGYWGTICDSGWDMRDARVVCRQLGYKDAARILQRSEVPSGSGQIWLFNVTCTGEEQNISSCSHRGWGISYCDHSLDAGVECSTTEFTATPVRLRLQGPLSANGTGHVEVLHHGYWGAICARGWDRENARVVCRQLGYDPDGAKTFQWNLVAPAPGPLWLKNVRCIGNEQNITSCSYDGWGFTSCSSDGVAGVHCYTIDFTGVAVRLRLQGPLGTNGAGRVEVLYHGYWGTICDRRWDINDARVVCRQLGYRYVVRTLQRNDVPSGSGLIWLSDLYCTGNEQNISSCSHDGWGSHRCSHNEDAGVHCTNTDFTGVPVKLRLQGPLSANGSGRVEVLYHGFWGTICDHGWDMRDARVVCRQLGYPGAVRALHSQQVPSGSGQIWLNEVSCTGKEENITSCPHYGWGVHNCVHDEDAGVECSTIDPTGHSIAV